MTELALAFAPDARSRPELVFRPSGFLRDRVIGGEPADVFASANLEHPQALVDAKRADAALPFARNRLCVLAAPGVDASSETVLDALVDPAWKLGTSMPGFDPSGDYAWRLSDKAEAIMSGARLILAGKARKLTGGPHSMHPVADRSIYTRLVESGEADVFITYRTNAQLACRENSALRIIELPASLAVGADYAIATLRGAPPSAAAFTRFVLGASGQSILERHGFEPARAG